MDVRNKKRFCKRKTFLTNLNYYKKHYELIGNKPKI